MPTTERTRIRAQAKSCQGRVCGNSSVSVSDDAGRLAGVAAMDTDRRSGANLIRKSLRTVPISSRAWSRHRAKLASSRSTSDGSRPSTAPFAVSPADGRQRRFWNGATCCTLTTCTPSPMAAPTASRISFCFVRHAMRLRTRSSRRPSARREQGQGVGTATRPMCLSTSECFAKMCQDGCIGGGVDND